MKSTKTLALDVAGGDYGAEVVVPAALHFAKRNPQAELILVGQEDVIRSHLGAQVPERVRIHHASQMVGMDELPAQALRKKKDSSMRVAINLVKEGIADAAVSAGNTGALTATARYVLKTVAEIQRPAICTALPSIKGHTHMLDLGANIECTAEHLVQFAIMGSILASAVDGNKSPRVGLLNIGEEDIKGNEQVKEAGRLLEQTNLNYVGYVEGDDIYKGTVDVVVTDGFVGNVSLKSSEGAAKMIAHYLRQEFRRSPYTKLIGLLAKPVLNAFKYHVDPRRHNGASLLGLQGIVIKSHGGADRLAFANAMKIALLEIENNIPAQISHYFEQEAITRRSA